MNHLKSYYNYLFESKQTFDYEVRYELTDYPSYDPINIYKFDDLKDAENQYEYDEYDDGEYLSKRVTKTLSKNIYDNNGDIDDSQQISIDTYQYNDSSDKLLEEVEKWFKKEYSSNDYKYHLIEVENPNNYTEVKYIHVRIADHTENIKNIDRFGSYDYNLSVVIADLDVTRNRFWSNGYERRRNEEELTFNSDDDIDEIKQKISDKMTEIIGILEDSF